MAIMFPSEFPEHLQSEPMYRGEFDTFKALCKLPDEYEVFYNRNVRQGETISATERPIDFIVTHPEKGLLGIEVKGGKVRINEHVEIEQYYEGRWNFKDPYKQNKDALRDLRDTVKGDGGHYYIHASTAVIFPNTTRDDFTQNRKYRSPDSAFCSDELSDLVLYIPKAFSKPRFEKSFKKAWKNGGFIDIRRRLLNMPQATRTYKPAKKEKWFGKSKKPIAKKESVPLENVSISSVQPQEEVTELLVEENEVIPKNWPRAPYLPPRPEPYPTTHHEQKLVSSITTKKRQHLTWYEVLIAAGTFIGAFGFFYFVFKRM